MRLRAGSRGLWRKRRDLAALFEARVLPPFVPGGADAVAGWGNRPSGLRARRSDLPHVILEDGFLHGWRPGGAEPAASYIVDRTGVHYDASASSDLEATIRGGETGEPERARRLMDRLRKTRLTKYNAAPVVPLAELGIARPFVLLLEQVEGDASLGDDDPWAAMLREARARFPGHRLVVRAHPAARGRGPLARLVEGGGEGALVLDRACNPWPLLEGAAHVFTHSSHAGFEALMAETPVTLFGRPFFAGWGLTEDRAPCERRGVRRSLETVFAAAYLAHSRYLDLHDRTPCEAEDAVEQLLVVRDSRARNRTPVVTGGFSPWRRRATAPFLHSRDGPPRHYRRLADAVRAAEKASGDLAVWGADPEPAIDGASGARVVRMEDGFVRSQGLGAALAFPCSLVREAGPHLHFDARGPNGIERALLADPPDAAERARARALVSRIVAGGVTKYGAGRGTLPALLPDTQRERVLVVGQVEDDQSIRFGAPGTRTNTALLREVRALFPDAVLAYRDHPDVRSGLRPGRAERGDVDLAVDDHSITDLLGWCDRVETITSLTGFEALLRGVAVGTHGWPFYAGWGLTDDRLERAPRGEASLDALAAVALLRYADHVHPRSRLPCSPERLVEALANAPPPTAGQRAKGAAGLLVGRLKRVTPFRR